MEFDWDRVSRQFLAHLVPAADAKPRIAPAAVAAVAKL
jgi:hypothetical protein